MSRERGGAGDPSLPRSRRRRTRIRNPAQLRGAALVRWPMLALIVGSAACAYFNAIYNAQRLAEEGDRAAERGDAAGAREAYAAAAEKAERGYARDPDGRWADDALFIIGRGRFAAGAPEAARDALQKLLAEWPGSPHATPARAYLGAVEARAGRNAEAVALLDDALAALPRDAPEAGLALYWRARARQALLAEDSAPPAAELELVRSDLASAVAAGGGPGRSAALELARLDLRSAEAPADLAGARALLEPLAGDRAADRLRYALNELEEWIALAELPHGDLALFAAAELARDRLGAPLLAVRLFHDYADARPGDVWAAKALLAALALGTAHGPELRRRLGDYAGNVYVAAARGEPVGDEYEAAELRLDRTLASLRAAGGEAMYRVLPADTAADTLEARS